MNFKEIAIEFRKAIDVAIKSGDHNFFFDAFPEGMCGFTSDLLAVCLIENGYFPVFYANGSYRGQSHTWLEVEGNVIDITADQFKNKRGRLRCNIPVYIGERNEWYCMFSEWFDTCPHYGKESWADERKMQNIYDTIMYFMGRS